jgi:hypothetical protein
MRRALDKLKILLRKSWENNWEREIDTISNAIRARNHAAHSAITIHYTRVEYADGSGGHYEAVLSLMGKEEYDELNLLTDLALQQEATEAVVRIFQAVLEQSASDD